MSARAIRRAGLLVSLAVVMLAGCGAMRPPTGPGDGEIVHDGYLLACTGVPQDVCIARADALRRVFQERNPTVRPDHVSIRGDDRFTWCWVRRPDLALYGVLTGHQQGGCTRSLDWLKEP